MQTVLAHPGNMADAQNAAIALMQAGVLQAFVTTFAYRSDSVIAGLLRGTPLTERLTRELKRRAIDGIPRELVHCYPLWEWIRTAASRLGAGPIVADCLWDRMIHSFDRVVADRYVPRAQAVQAFEYTALRSFERAKSEGIARILHLPSLDSSHFEKLQQAEKNQWPELVGPHDAYFTGKFARRYERRRQEIALADVIIANSALTARSHVAAGADPAKVFTVPLAAPPIVDELTVKGNLAGQPLDVMWAGPFSLRKGAHYLLRAWRRLKPGENARLHVYGQPQLPARLHAGSGEGIIFYGSVPKSILFRAYESADVLVFPTLSDGFGTVVMEAMAHGLPVITTDQAGAADLVTTENGLIVPAADAESLARALQWCLDNRRRLQAMRFAALETAKRRQWPDFRRELIAALDTGLTRAGYEPSFAAIPVTCPATNDGCGFDP